jgi:3-oxoacyl-[acyl-carrier protein] reductase
MIDLSSKKVLITGGSKGIGKACVEIFSRAGANVFFTYKSDKKSAEKLIKQHSPTKKIKAFQLYIGNVRNLEKKFSEIISEIKGVNILVNNAGIWTYGEADKMSLEEWDKTIQTNLTGTFLISKTVIPLMKKNKYGRIINMTSTAGQRGEPFHSHYAASKGGVISFTKSLAPELGKFNITVNSVAPGWVETDMTKDVFANKAYKKKIINEIPLKKIASADDIAGAVLFLASDLANHITGEILNLNGGSVLCG